MTPAPRRDHTALVLPVPEAAGLVEDPHIALLDPFLATGLVDDGVLAELRALFAALVPFGFVLGEQASFPTGSAYLSPQPVATFRRIIHQLRRAFPEAAAGSPLEAFVPHLPLPADVRPGAPLTAHAREAQLRVTDADGVRVLATFRFGVSAA